MGELKFSEPLVFEVKGFQTIEEFVNVIEIQHRVKRQLEVEERNRQLWGGKYCGRLRRGRRGRSRNPSIKLKKAITTENTEVFRRTFKQLLQIKDITIGASMVSLVVHFFAFISTVFSVTSVVETPFSGKKRESAPGHT